MKGVGEHGCGTIMYKMHPADQISYSFGLLNCEEYCMAIGVNGSLLFLAAENFRRCVGGGATERAAENLFLHGILSSFIRRRIH